MDKEAALNAIAEIDGCELDGRMIRVNEAQPKGRKSPPPTDEDDDVSGNDGDLDNADDAY